MKEKLTDPPSRYLNVDGAVVWDERLPNGARRYTRFFRGRWELFPKSDILQIVNLGVEISTEEATELIRAAELARTGCAFSDDVELDTA